MKYSFQHIFVRSTIASFVLAVSLLGLEVDTAPPSVPPPAPPPAPSSPVIQTVPHQQEVPGEDIFDIRGPIHIPASRPWLAWSASALAALGLGAWALLRRPRRKLPYELALDKLAATRLLMEDGNAQPFSLAVSEIVRLFIEECLLVRAAHRTTTEFLHDLVELPDSPLTAHREMLSEFLQHCDLAKFARWSLSVPQMEAMLVSASAFVVATGKPKCSNKLHAAKGPKAPTAAAEPVAANL